MNSLQYIKCPYCGDYLKSDNIADEEITVSFCDFEEHENTSHTICCESCGMYCNIILKKIVEIEYDYYTEKIDPQPEKEEPDHPCQTFFNFFKKDTKK